MAISPLVSLGFGTFSDIYKLVTLGYGASLVASSNWVTLAERVSAIYLSSFGASSSAVFTIPDANFYVRKFPWTDGVDNPGCFMVPVPEKLENIEAGRDDWGLGVLTVLTNATNRDLESGHDRLHYLRERAIGEFLNQRVGGLADYHKCDIEIQPIIEPVAFNAGYDATAFVVRAWHRKTRPTQAT